MDDARLDPNSLGFVPSDKYYRTYVLDVNDISFRLFYVFSGDVAWSLDCVAFPETPNSYSVRLGMFSDLDEDEFIDMLIHYEKAFDYEHAASAIRCINSYLQTHRRKRNIDEILEILP